MVVSFGGPEGQDDVLPFLENVLRGKNVPRERLLEVAEHYRGFGGVSPINEQNRALIAALQRELAAEGPQLPIYWGNRNWHPLLPETLARMAGDGKRHALAFVTSAYSSYSGCRQYREDIARAQEAVGPKAPRVDKLRVFFNHPGFVEPMVESVIAALGDAGAKQPGDATTLFTAHSIPRTMADNSRYVAQLNEACRLIANGAGLPQDSWELVFQSRSGPPGQPWLEPDVCERITELHAAGGLQRLVIVPVGFISDHMEVIYDLDHEAVQVCQSLGITCRRAATVGVHPRFVRMIRELVVERISPGVERSALGTLGPSHDVCPENCCLYPRTPPAAMAGGA
ncbi:MAG TPA: ferrochelatase [Lacipirellulaceae bacterium]|nr:ferrochelatase [Lacipirellulaceae bacterium]